MSVAWLEVCEGAKGSGAKAALLLELLEEGVDFIAIYFISRLRV